MIFNIERTRALRCRSSANRLRFMLGPSPVPEAVRLMASVSDCVKVRKRGLWARLFCRMFLCFSISETIVFASIKMADKRPTLFAGSLPAESGPLVSVIVVRRVLAMGKLCLPQKPVRFAHSRCHCCVLRSGG